MPPCAQSLPASTRSRSHATKPAEIVVDSLLTLRSALTLTGIRPAKVPNGATLMVVAERPDGSIEPLLWLYQFNPRFAHDYWYTTPLRFPPGTKIEVTPEAAGTVALLMKP